MGPDIVGPRLYVPGCAGVNRRDRVRLDISWKTISLALAPGFGVISETVGAAVAFV